MYNEERPHQTHDYRTASTKSSTLLIRSLSRYPVRSAESASSFIARPTSTDPLTELTPREYEVLVLREHEHGHIRVLVADLERRLQPLVTVRRRKPDVDEDCVRPLPLDHVQQLVGGLRLADELEPRAAQEAPQALADEERVLRDGEAKRHYGAATAA